MDAEVKADLVEWQTSAGGVFSNSSRSALQRRNHEATKSVPRAAAAAAAENQQRGR